MNSDCDQKYGPDTIFGFFKKIFLEKANLIFLFYVLIFRWEITVTISFFPSHASKVSYALDRHFFSDYSDYFWER